jgi:ribokinase
MSGDRMLMRTCSQDGIPDLCPLLDIVFVNEDEAAAISGVAVPDAAAAEPAARWFNARGCGLAVLTLGSEGALATAKGGPCYRQGSQLTINRFKHTIVRSFLTLAG